MMKIDAAFNGKLVEVVERFPVLYNFKLKRYSNRNEVDREWANVAKEVNESVDECLMEFISFKKTASQPAENMRKLFLLSLQLDVDEMTGAQLQLIKRKVGLLVEEILSADDELSLPSRIPSLRTSSSHSAEFYTHIPMSPSARSTSTINLDSLVQYLVALISLVIRNLI
ncbi:hypothetical protein PGB90_002100 [Kerria lacca]